MYESSTGKDSGSMGGSDVCSDSIALRKASSLMSFSQALSFFRASGSFGTMDTTALKSFRASLSFPSA